MNVKPTVEAIRKISKTLDSYSKEIEWSAKKLEQTGDLDFVSEVLQSVTNCISNLRLDLLATRPFREYERIIKDYQNVIEDLSNKDSQVSQHK